MFSLCTSCKQGFTGLTSFDRHFPPIVDGPKQLPCPDPATKGLVRKGVRQYNGETYPVWGMLAADGDNMPPHFTQGARMDTLIRGCTNCSKPFVKWGRGRPPAVCDRKGCDGKGEALEVSVADIGKYLAEDGTVRAERAVAAPSKPAKPASAKAKPLPVPPALPAPIERGFQQVPVPPPAVVDGKTLAQALADGDLHPDTFAEPPFAEDAFDSLYGEQDETELLEIGIIEPEPDDYMHSLLAAGSLRGYSIA